MNATTLHLGLDQNQERNRKNAQNIRKSSSASFVVVITQDMVKPAAMSVCQIFYPQKPSNVLRKKRRSNFRRDKKSYLEDSFEKWLVAEKFQSRYESEYTIRNHITGKWYFVDFYFPDHNLIVELDGKQHEKPSHKQADMIRDEFITYHLGIDVFRISHKEYQEGSRISELSNILRRCGTARIRTESLTG